MKMTDVRFDFNSERVGFGSDTALKMMEPGGYNIGKTVTSDYISIELCVRKISFVSTS